MIAQNYAVRFLISSFALILSSRYLLYGFGIAAMNQYFKTSPMLQTQPATIISLLPDAGFPWHIYPTSLVDSLKTISYHNNIPMDYLGAQVLFTIASLAGNMYIGDIGGLTKPILYLAKIGPSGVGKTPSYHKVMGDIISPLRARYNEDHKLQLKEYRIRQIAAKQAKHEFDEDAPQPRIRVTEATTLEAIYKYCETSPAGFGVVYDEGERFFTEINKYSSGGSSISFWNESFNGRTTSVSRVDSEKERFIAHPAVSVDIGLQSSRMANYFTTDAIESGILNRFLMVECDYTDLNENIDLFSPRIKICEDWKALVVYLFDQGNLFKLGQSIPVSTDSEGRQAINKIASEMIRASNQMQRSIIEGNASRHIFNYRSKLFLYFQRFCLILAIMRNARNPVITRREAIDAQALCNYFEQNATSIIHKLFNYTNTSLSEKEQLLLSTLPTDRSFTNLEAELACEDLKLDKSFFRTAFNRKFKKLGLIVKRDRNNYDRI